MCYVSRNQMYAEHLVIMSGMCFHRVYSGQTVGLVICHDHGGAVGALRMLSLN